MIYKEINIYKCALWALMMFRKNISLQIDKQTIKSRKVEKTEIRDLDKTKYTFELPNHSFNFRKGKDP